MVVRIRFGRGPVVTRRSGKNAGIARLASSLLTLIAISLGSFGAWRLATDLDLAGDFIFRDGILSHWQVWLGVAAAIQYGAWRLLHYAKTAVEEAIDETEAATEPEEQTETKVAANV
jgi:hypothetical protein